MKNPSLFLVVAVVMVVGASLLPAIVSAQSVSASAGAGSSATVAALEAQIATLLSQITSLRADIGSANTMNMSNGMMMSSSTMPEGSSNTLFCQPFNRNLSIGSQGSDVTQLQTILSQNSNFPKADITGYFGPITARVLANFQMSNGVAASSSATGFFGSLTRNFLRIHCPVTPPFQPGGPILPPAPPIQPLPPVNTSSVESFSANPQSGSAPLAVQFIASVPQGTTLGNGVDFGDGTQGRLGVVPVCSQCNAEGIVSHTYAAAGTYTAALTNGICSCPANGVCNCPNIQILATTTVIVGPASTTTMPIATSTTAANIQQLNAPGSVTLSMGGIGEIRNKNFYFTMQGITSSSATIQITPVGCWNSFPSDPRPRIVCMIAMVPIPPQVLTLGEVYTNGNYSITLTQLASSTATFEVQ